MELNTQYQILLYYKYVRIKNPEEEMLRQRAVCEALGLKGRIIVAHEGINGTLEGTKENTELYVEWMKRNHKFKTTHWKRSTGLGDAFPKLSIKLRKEIVSLHLEDGGFEDIDPNIVTGKHLKPEKLKEWFTKGKEFYIVDMRNDYELDVGQFEGTIFPGLKNFRDLRERLSEIENLKDKTVLTVCTGGVRCEKASGFLKTKGFKDVYQLDGGMVTYMEKFPNDKFKGSLYVFDKRTTVTFDTPNGHEIIGKCDMCKAPTETYVDCANNFCGRHFLACKNCVPENRTIACNKYGCELKNKSQKKVHA